jgi:fructose transport system substrate-binding protein
MYHPTRRGYLRIVAGSASAVIAISALSACSSGSSGSSSSGGSIMATLILKDFTNPYWVSMKESAQAEAKKLGITLKVTAGTSDTDTSGQISEIEDAVAAGDKGIIIASAGNAVNDALLKARKAGLVVIAVDTPPVPANVANATFATDNTKAGVLTGKWAAAKLAGGSADIAMLDDTTSEVNPVDVDRDHGFLTGMGIPVGNAGLNGDEPKQGHYTGGKGGTFKISCQLPTNADQTGGQSAMETCLSKDSKINLVYVINESAAEGAAKALKDAGKSGVNVVTIDGGCANLPYIQNGEIAATAGQFPGKMALDGVQAIYSYAKTGKVPANSQGQTFVNTGTELYTDDPQPGVPSITSSQASKVCWG